MRRSRYGVADIRRAVRRHRERLLALPNVEYVTVGWKERAGERLRALAARVYVRRKKDVPSSARVPERLRDGLRLVQTDVVETGEPLTALVLRGGDAIEGRSAGTVGLAFRDREDREWFLTCAHVVGGLDADATGDPVWGEDGEVVGEVQRTLPVQRNRVNRFDIALVGAMVPVDPFTVGDATRQVVDHGQLRAGSKVEFHYTTRGERVRCSLPEPVETPIAVRFGKEAEALFRGCLQLRVVSGKPTPGHSGALLVRERGDGLLACGIVFAGNRERLLVNRLGPALRAVGGDFHDPTVFLPRPG